MKAKILCTKLVAILFFAVFLSSCQKPLMYRHSHERPGTSAKWQHGFQGFLRYDGYGKVAGDMEVPIADYVKKGNNVKIRMVGVVHLADRDYYWELQRVLDRADYVLYEGVHFGKDKTKLLKSAEVQWDAIGEMLGMTGQLSSINYNRKNWEQCDPATDLKMIVEQQIGIKTLPKDQLKIMMKNIERTQQMQGQMMERLQLVKRIRTIKRVLSRVTGISVRMIEDYGKHRYAMNMARTQKVGGPGLQWARLLRQLERQILRYRRMLPRSRELDEAIKGFQTFIDTFEKNLKRQARFIIIERNQHVMKVLREKLKKLANPKKPYTLAVFYGCGHMPDFERRLKKMGYQRSRMVWLKAWKINDRGRKNPPKFPFSAKKETPKAVDLSKGSVLNLLKAYLAAKKSSGMRSILKMRQVERDMVQALKKMQNQEKTLQGLLAALKNTDEEIRVTAALFVKNMTSQKTKDRVVEALLERMEKDSSYKVRTEACRSFTSSHPTLTEDLMKRCLVLFVRDSATRDIMVYFLPRFAEKVVPHLIPLIKSKDKYVKIYAMRSLARNKKRVQFHKQIVPLLIDNMDSTDEMTLNSTASLLGGMGSKGAPAMGKLIKCFVDPKYRGSKGTILGAFGDIGPAAAPAVPEILKYYKNSKSSSARREAVATLSKIGSPVAKILPLIKELLVSKDSWTKGTALEACRDMGPKAAPLVPLIAKELGSKSYFTRIKSIRALEAIGPKARSAVPALKELAEKKPNMKGAVRRALGKIEGKK